MIHSGANLEKKHPGIFWDEVIEIDGVIIGRRMRSPNGILCIYFDLECMIGQYAFCNIWLYKMATAERRELIIGYEGKFYWFSPREIYESSPALDVIRGHQVVKFPMRLGKNIDKLGKKPEVAQTGSLFE